MLFLVVFSSIGVVSWRKFIYLCPLYDIGMQMNIIYILWYKFAVLNILIITKEVSKTCLDSHCSEHLWLVLNCSFFLKLVGLEIRFNCILRLRVTFVKLFYFECLEVSSELICHPHPWIYIFYSFENSIFIELQILSKLTCIAFLVQCCVEKWNKTSILDYFL